MLRESIPTESSSFLHLERIDRLVALKSKQEFVTEG